jgi:adenylate cyclase
LAGLRDLVRFEPSRGIQLPTWLDRLISLGIVSTDPKIVRRQKIVNVAAYTGALNSFSRFVSSFFYFSDSPDFLLLQVFSGVSALAALSIHRLHRFGEHAGAHALVTWFLLSVSGVAFMFGLQSQILSYFTLTGLILFVFGVHNWRVFVSWLVVFCAVIFALIKYAPSAGMVTQIRPEILGITSVQTLLAALAINAAVIFYVLFILQRTEGDLERQSQRAEALLGVVLPERIAQRLRVEPERRIADRLDGVSILFADLARFTEAAHAESPENVVAYLDEFVRAFDEMCGSHGVDKIKTIGDAYMAAGGLQGDSKAGAIAIGRLGLAMVRLQESRPPLGAHRLQLRVGIHIGPAIAGVIGDTRISYDLWGDAVNVASRMESHGVAGRVQVSEAYRETVASAFVLEERGETEIKGIGTARTYFLVEPR